ncbi:MAG: helix-turn-helix domain-containing protein [Oscillospiraceae bacterium]|jgi:transcriptional regulator with XRE-family HTH domain|nr:helix-turn-helix domain-containing protein [Oscillospiraceae bacterium]
MILTIGEKIRILLKRKGMTVTSLAGLLGMSRQNLINKLSRDNFSEREAHAIAAALDAEFITVFRLADGTEL